MPSPAGISKSSDSSGTRERDATVSFSMEPFPMAAVEITSGSTYREDMHAKWKEIAQST